ncbi:hypothetical protein CWB96_15165 [Pseudoalteromonas citrea]|uniref:Uncharacterized protein n=1 Tax=Pseudoalteromonas citrea TaxID=43655 RepID=A0A5S3XLS1_9GAMM|nr:hypothetical protein [Pseudoalteromonas citrea]TMP41531.1 hypothetical protein CWB97_14535 [Pseudoalteromonas citrea]TMP56416.1 hypothetical protein CWB96_15165 [Pseudoalteromonas citrea]
MNWEVINGITGIIGAIGTVASIRYITTHQKEPNDNNKIVSTYKLMSFLLACSGWVLLCFAYLWFFEPLGAFVSDSDYQKFFGIMLSFPAIVMFIFGIRLMYNGNIARD